MLRLSIAFLIFLAGSSPLDVIMTTKYSTQLPTTTSSEKSVNQNSPLVRIVLEKQPSALGLSYDIENDLKVPIYVFDRLYDLERKQLSPDWMYITFSQETAMISRQIFPLPPGLIHEEPEVPYGRLLAPGAHARGQLRAQLPLPESNPYSGFVHPGGAATRVETKISSLIFQIGWAPASDLHGGFPGELEGEKLVLFSYHEAILKQKLASSPNQSVELTGISIR